MRPSFVFMRCVSDLSGRPERCADWPTLGMSLSTNVATWYCSTDVHSSTALRLGSPSAILRASIVFVLMMSMSFCVRSSSERWLLSCSTEGRTDGGGTGSTAHIIQSGRHQCRDRPSASTSSSEMRCSRRYTKSGSR